LALAETVAHRMAPTTVPLEILVHLAAALLCQLCLQVAVEDVITRQVVNQIVAVEVVAVDQVGTAVLKHFMLVPMAL
jgi:hypothetical protein